MQDAVDLTRALVGEDGRTAFEDCSQPYGRDSSPFNITERLTAEAIRFGWVSAGFTSIPENDTPDRLIVVLEGSLDVTLARISHRVMACAALSRPGARPLRKSPKGVVPLRSSDFSLRITSPGRDAGRDPVRNAG